jgi:PH domain
MATKQGSFTDQVALKSKTDKMFGLDQQESSMRPQKEGWLIKKPFRGSSGFTSKLARKRWFAVKDSFIFWWDNEPARDGGFDTHPKGAIPLGGASITLLSDKMTMDIRHPVFTKGECLTVKAADFFEASEWFDVIQAGMKALP